MINNPYDFYRPFDPYKIINDTNFDNAINQLTYEIEKHEIRKRKRTGKEATALHTHMRAVVSDLYAVWDHDPDMYLSISRGRPTYQNPIQRYQPLKLTYQPIINVLDGLSKPAIGYIEMKKGFFDFPGKRLTRIRATKKLITLLKDGFKILAKFRRLDNQETIFLKDDNKQLMDYTDTLETSRMRDSLKTINEMLQRAQIDLDLTLIERESLKKDLRRKIEEGEKVYDPTRTQLIRVFNKGSFKKGGRFYGGWWLSLPRAYRNLITINGAKTVELDYNCLIAAMLYSLEDSRLKGDAYSLPGYDPTVYREEIKTAFYKLLFTTTGKKLSFKDIPLLKKSETAEGLEKALRGRHPIIEKYFRQSYSRHLQYLDSCITENILLRFIKLNKPVLPIHDSYIVLHSDEQLLRRIMQDEYQRVMKVDYCIGIK